METINAFNVNSQEVEVASVTVDANGESVIRFEDGSFFKLPAGMTSTEIDEQLAIYQEHNTQA